MSITSGILLSLAWPSNGFSPLLFVSFIPLLWIEEILIPFHKKYRRYLIFLFSFITFIIWNGLVVWWLHYSKRPNGSYAWEAYLIPVFLNSIFMSSLFQIYFLSKNKLGIFLSQIFLICLWISFEKLQLEWELSWPWMNIGNGMANYFKWIQWYEYTGTLGGTLWIWIINFSIFNLIKNFSLKREKIFFYKKIFFNSLKILLPIFFSYFLYFKHQKKGKKTEIIIIQPNIDPYKEKYKKSENVIVNELIKLSKNQITKNTRFLLAPETVIPSLIHLNFLKKNLAIRSLCKYICSNPKLVFILGVEIFNKYNFKKINSLNKISFKESKNIINVFNAALQIDYLKNFSIYFKSKLVPGVEFFPYKNFFYPIIGNFLLNFGGTVMNHQCQLEPSIFIHPIEKISIAPVICYESIFGEYISKYILKGAQLIFIITNDGWWGNSDGHKQHLAYARLRAIENRRFIARSSNTGISAFINQRGDILSTIPYGKKGILRMSIFTNNNKTFYSIYGDFIARFAILFSIFLLIYLIYFIII